jgi:hypothetical protein
MIFPLHCRFIGVVDKDLRNDYRPEDKAYFSSQYIIVFEARASCDIYSMQSNGEGFMRKWSGLQKIADARETLVYGSPVDITNRSYLIKKASELCKGKISTVVFKGIDRHYTFVHEPSTAELTTVDVFDVAPPWPAWLAYNVKRLDDAGLFGELGLIFDYHILNLKDLEDPKRTTIFPCRASGLSGLFMDSLDQEPKGDIKLVGCNTSRAVFETRYPSKKYEHVNICPLSTRKPDRPFILRCCQSDKLGIKEIDGVKGVVVHWGANPRETYDAIKMLTAALQKNDR